MTRGPAPVTGLGAVVGFAAFCLAGWALIYVIAYLLTGVAW
jgi:hypothetical protein